ncbi:alkaline phosphatase family protein [Candidatus Parabeggiatoa sp. HSG14]|uniref:alkaline phosphatase family protein n=1 Tax=Candidatus Parabeggiatoa sp. HSG14 TaxID=3055593 RepID=UPI0025A83A78|nr:alkaline phosphatase family protein [Thiotrichales bacterium HSG14]
MYLPNYEENSIVNLVSTIADSLGIKTGYQGLKSFDKKALNTRNVVLIIVDGLGYEWLLKKAKNSFIAENLQNKLTSVFPSTTATAIPAFMTGKPAQQHGLTGWYVFLKELGVVSMILPFISRVKGSRFHGSSDIAKTILTEKSLFEDFQRDCYQLLPKEIARSDFTIKHKGKAKIVDYTNPCLLSFFHQLQNITEESGKKFVYAYWSWYDHLCHEFGPDSELAFEHFQDLDNKLERFIKKLAGKDVTLLITADHGFIQAEHKIDLKDHPKLKECLVMPLSGESRVAYCYVKPNKTKQFEQYVKEKLENFCHLYKSSELIEKNFFGLGKPHPKLQDRIGDFVLIMKEGCVLKDALMDESAEFMEGYHGGVSKEEMWVPLSVIRSS